MHFAPKQQCFLKEPNHSMRSPSDPFVIEPNKLLVLQVNNFCMPFYTPQSLHIFLSIFYVGLVSEKEKKIAS